MPKKVKDTKQLDRERQQYLGLVVKLPFEQFGGLEKDRLL